MYCQYCPGCGTKNERNEAVCRRCNQSLIDLSAEVGKNDIGAGQRTPAPQSSPMEDFQIEGATLVKYKGKDSCVVIPDGIITIGQKAFENNAYLVSVTLPEGVKVIDDFAFLGCTNLVEVCLCNSLKAIGRGVFNNCIKLASIFIPKGVLTMGTVVFYRGSRAGKIDVYCEIDKAPSNWDYMWDKGESSSTIALPHWGSER